MPRRASTRTTTEGTQNRSANSMDPSPNSAPVEQYRRLALALPGAIESSHMGAPDFRVNGKIFATLAYQARGLGTLKLTPEQQAGCLADAPEHFTPAPGGWGRMGMTLIRLNAPRDVIAGALGMAHRNVVQQTSKPARHPRRRLQ